MKCSTPCDEDCDVLCHEMHIPTYKRSHSYAACPGHEVCPNCMALTTQDEGRDRDPYTYCPICHWISV